MTWAWLLFTIFFCHKISNQLSFSLCFICLNILDVGRPLIGSARFFFLRTISWCVFGFGNGEFTFYCHFCAGISSSRSSTVSFEGSPLSAGGTEGSLISIQYYPNLSSTAPNGPGSESPKYVKIILASNIPLEIAFVCLLHLHV